MSLPRLLPALFALALLPSCQNGTKPTSSPARPNTIILKRVEATQLVLKGKYYSGSEVDQKPVPIGPMKIPRYPVELRNAGINGTTRMLIAISETGTVDDVKIINATDERFSISVREAVMTWNFKPARKGGKNIKCWMTMPVRFIRH